MSRRVAARAVAPAKAKATPEVVLVYRTVRVEVVVIGHFRARVWQALARRRSSVGGLARDLGIARRIVHRWLLSDRLTEAVLGRIEAALGVDRSYWSTPLQAGAGEAHKSRAWTAGRVRARVGARVPR